MGSARTIMGRFNERGGKSPVGSMCREYYLLVLDLQTCASKGDLVDARYGSRTWVGVQETLWVPLTTAPLDATRSGTSSGQVRLDLSANHQ